MGIDRRDLGRHNAAARHSEAINVASIHSVSERSRYLVEITRRYLGRGDDIVAVHLSLKGGDRDRCSHGPTEPQGNR
jgi:formamidopyrimidine-DNA glycosylase